METSVSPFLPWHHLLPLFPLETTAVFPFFRNPTEGLLYKNPPLPGKGQAADSLCYISCGQEDHCSLMEGPESTSPCLRVAGKPEGEMISLPFSQIFLTFLLLSFCRLIKIGICWSTWQTNKTIYMLGKHFRC